MQHRLGLQIEKSIKKKNKFNKTFLSANINLITYLQNFKPNKKKYFFVGAMNALSYRIIQKHYKNICYYEKPISDKLARKITVICEKIYKKILSDLIINLNQIHGTKYNYKFWQIIFGRHIKELICHLYIKFTNIQTLLAKQNFKKIYSLDCKDYDLVDDSYNSFISKYYTSERSSKLSTKIIRFFKKDKLINYIYSKRKIPIQDAKIRTSGYFYKNKALSFLNYFSNKKFFFYDTNLNFFFEKKLEVYLAQFPSYFKFPLKKQKVKINKKLREQIKFKFKTESKFEKFLKVNLIFFLPNYLIENFRNIFNELDNMKLPLSPKLLITGTGFINEHYNFYSAKLVSKGAKYAVLQHGAVYNTNLTNDYLFENSEFLDGIFTWGSKQKKNHIKMFNHLVIGKLQKIDKKKNKNFLTIVCDKIESRPTSLTTFKEKEEKFFDMLDIVKDFPNEIKNRTIFKLFPDQQDGFLQIMQKYLKNLDIKFYEDKTKFFDILNETRICIFNYDSTGLYENFLYDVPSIWFKFNSKLIKKNILPDFENLKKEKILIQNRINLQSHLINIWNEPYKWWHSKKTQKAIKNFNDKYNNKPIYPLNELKKKLITMTK